eukprot:CAMPEP_0177720328 /NCGR_PEP_ID=MMETSP0484_2-20121128/16568_1 /TAXON_ID=354590 /ORGANISM="Rhodomonas lens, Strain RHODO" /LENGTH=32 /DNA_ID= /DNA_START= /DNA_END= /DNA_ORIENTATION=
MTIEAARAAEERRRGAGLEHSVLQLSSSHTVT